MASVSSCSANNTSRNQNNSTSDPNRSKSCDTVCTSNSTCYLQRKKPVNPLAYSIRGVGLVSNTNNIVRQRVLSAKRLKVRSLQNQLNDANFHLAELSRENQALKTLQKRQDKALSKYENTNAELPRLLRSHEEDLRILTEKNKTLRKNLKDSTDQLKLKNDELKKACEHLNHYEKLNKDKRLFEREKLSDQLDDVKMRLKKADDEITILNRKLLLESKTSKQRLNAEMSKHRQCQKDLMQAMEEIERLTTLLETKENTAYPRTHNRLTGIATKRQSTSLIALVGRDHSNNAKLATVLQQEDIPPKTPVTDVKLAPLFDNSNNTSVEINSKSSVMDIPSESVKQRLSSSNGNIGNCGTNSSSTSDSRPLSSSIGKLPRLDHREIDTMCQNKTSTELRQTGVSDKALGRDKIRERTDKINDGLSGNKVRFGGRESGYDQSDGDSDHLQDEDDDSEGINKEYRVQYSRSRPSSGEKFDELTTVLDNAIQRAAQNGCDEFERKLGDYCSAVVSNVKNCHDVIENHKENLKISQHDTEVIEATLRKTEKLESKLKKSLFSMDKEDMSIVSDILSEEFKFQAAVVGGSTNKMDIDKVRGTVVNDGDKKKLLATLRAIDNGDSLEDSEHGTPSPPDGRTGVPRSRLMKEMYT